MNAMRDFAEATMALAYVLADDQADQTSVALREEEARDAFRRLAAEEQVARV